MEKESLVPLQLHQIAQLNPKPNLKIEHHRVRVPPWTEPAAFRDVSTIALELINVAPLLTGMQDNISNKFNSHSWIEEFLK